jgi:membrane carboxypeptidase/penicillin-binding protein PbpC
MGFTPSLAVGVWAGNNDNSVMARGADGVFVAAPIWNKIMERGLNGKPVEKFKTPKPNNTKKAILQGKLEAETTINVDAVTGKEIPGECLASWPPALVSQQTIKEVHSILHYVDRADPLGDPPADPTKDPMYKRWEEPVQAWAKKQKLLTTRPAMESCALRDPSLLPVVSIASPADGASVSGNSVTATAAASGPNPIESVQYLLDDRDIGTSTEAPYAVAIPLNGVSTGSHTLKAVATDSVKNIATTSITISVTGGEATQTLAFVNPSGPTVISASSFPYFMTASVSHPSGIASLTAIAYDSGGGQTTIDSIANPPSGLVRVQWSNAPAPGNYRLLLRALAGNGTGFSSDLVSVTVTP